jgi:hypothetical protein
MLRLPAFPLLDEERQLVVFAERLPQPQHFGGVPGIAPDLFLVGSLELRAEAMLCRLGGGQPLVDVRDVASRGGEALPLCLARAKLLLRRREVGSGGGEALPIGISRCRTVVRGRELLPQILELRAELLLLLPRPGERALALLRETSVEIALLERLLEGTVSRDVAPGDQHRSHAVRVVAQRDSLKLHASARAGEVDHVGFDGAGPALPDTGRELRPVFLEAVGEAATERLVQAVHPEQAHRRVVDSQKGSVNSRPDQAGRLLFNHLHQVGGRHG